MSFLRRLWHAVIGRPVPNPKEQQLRTHARRLAVVAHARAADLRGDQVRADYRRADRRIGR